MSQWRKVQPGTRNLENILTRFLDKMKPLQEQLEKETKNLEQEIAKTKSEGQDG